MHIYTHTHIHTHTRAQDGALVIANRAEEHENAPSSDEYIRMKMVWGGNIIRPAAQAGHTLLTTVTHINPGGMGETRFGSVFLNAMAATGPRKFVNGMACREDCNLARKGETIRSERARARGHCGRGGRQDCVRVRVPVSGDQCPHVQGCALVYCGIDKTRHGRGGGVCSRTTARVTLRLPAAPFRASHPQKPRNECRRERRQTRQARQRQATRRISSGGAGGGRVLVTQRPGIHRRENTQADIASQRWSWNLVANLGESCGCLRHSGDLGRDSVSLVGS